uniref:U3 small nucleolar RNA-associated protein 6 n=1 Tax=Aureoumbra lagunensis TaxID=44058 RepID=A0A7S3NEU0_9STRA|mmetsp:Transcript_1578/g.2396  ORF Transcript_1578/g.2396 Transcript_1578/m.2396 type:complete len:191 (+) Transcript_1578:34-606(+)
MNQDQRDELLGKRALRTYEENGVLSEEEACRVVACRERFLQNARSGGRVALLLWLKYELKFEKLMQIRGAKIKKRMPSKVADLLIKRFPSELRIWATAIEINSQHKKKQKKLITAALKLHPASSWLWRTAARIIDNKNQKRILLQRGLRSCPKRRKLLLALLALIKEEDDSSSAVAAFKKSALIHFGYEL